MLFFGGKFLQLLKIARRFWRRLNAVSLVNRGSLEKDALHSIIQRRRFKSSLHINMIGKERRLLLL